MEVKDKAFKELGYVRFELLSNYSNRNYSTSIFFLILPVNQSQTEITTNCPRTIIFDYTG